MTSEEVLTGAEFDAAWLDILADAEQEATESFERWQFGKLDVTPRYLKWVESDGKRKPQEISAADYASAQKRQRSLELVFSVDIQEFNPALEWEYSRRVGVGSLDWKQVLVPSIEAIVGEGAMAGDKMGATLGQLRGKYVRVKDVLQTPTKKNPNPEFRTISFDTIYDNRDECYSAWYAVYGGSADGASDELAAPTGWEDEWDGWDFDVVVNEIADQIADPDYGSLQGVADNYYGVSLDSLIRALAAGGMSAPQIAKLDDGLKPADVKKIIS